MAEFSTLPPSQRRPAPEGFFQGGMMPATGQNITAMIIVDVRSLGLTRAQGKKLERSVREHVTQQLRDMKVDVSGRSAIDLSSAVFGISIE